LSTISPDAWGAFVPGPRARASATGSGPLDGLRFAVKDLIDVAGIATTGGQPEWAASHPVPSRDAPVVARLRAAGASVDGKSVTDELAFSLEGENAHHGTPRNPCAPDRLPGGSSSGSAVAVAAGLVDFALGTDTGGSVRVPAAFCGLFGFRPTHGRVPLDGIVPFAPSFDTVGWFARDGALLARVGEVLLERTSRRRPRLRLAWAADVAALCATAVRARVHLAARCLALECVVDAFDTAPQTALDAYVHAQHADNRAALGEWIRVHRPRFGANIAPRFAALDTLRESDLEWARRWRLAAARRWRARLEDGPSGWVFPTTPTPALALDASAATRADFYRRALTIDAIAGHAGLPQVTMPAGTVDGAPVGLSILGPHGSDETLLALARAWKPERE
jgi:amidase